MHEHKRWMPPRLGLPVALRQDLRTGLDLEQPLCRRAKPRKPPRPERRRKRHQVGIAQQRMRLKRLHRVRNVRQALRRRNSGECLHHSLPGQASSLSAELWRGPFGSVLSKTGRSTLLRETLLVKHVEPLAATLHIYGTGIVRLGGNSLSLERAFLRHLVSEQRSVSVEHYDFGVFHKVIGEIEVGKHFEHLRPA